jgi:hypothetical protein
VNQTIQKRITRRIAVIVGTFALGLLALYGLIQSLETRNEEMRLHRTDVREFFRVLTLFQGDFDRLVQESGAAGMLTPIIGPDAFLTTQTSAKGHITEIERMKFGKFGPNVEGLRASFEAYAGAARMFLVETQSLGQVAETQTQPTGLALAKDRLDEAVLSSHDPELLSRLTTLSRSHLGLLRDRIFNSPSEIMRDDTGNRDGLFRLLGDLTVIAQAGATKPGDKSKMAAAADAYRASVDDFVGATRRRASTLTEMTKAREAVARNVAGFRQALFAENDLVYAQEEEYRKVSRTTIGAAVVLLSLGFVFLTIIIGGRLRREAFLEEDRSKIFKDFALSRRSVSWETDASCRYIRRETSGAIDDSVPGRVGQPMIEAETAANITFDGPTAFDQVGERMPYRDILFVHTGESDQKTWWRSSGTPYYDVDGKFLGYRGISLDVTETKNYERAVAETVAR